MASMHLARWLHPPFNFNLPGFSVQCVNREWTTTMLWMLLLVCYLENKSHFPQDKESKNKATEYRRGRGVRGLNLKAKKKHIH